MLQISPAELVIGAAAGKGEKHHYIPVFYSNEWTGSDGRLCEFSRPHGAVKPKRVHPSGTGYVRGLYTVPRNDPHVSNFIEREFFKVTDNGAAAVLRMLRSGEQINWTSNNRSHWSRFILSLILRNPEYVARMAAEIVKFFDPSSTELSDKYRELRKPHEPETYEEYVARTEHPAGRTSVVAFQTIIDSPRMGGRLNKMRWSVVRFENPKHELLTSDRPVIMTNGLSKPGDHLALPIGPSALFVAANTSETERVIKKMNPHELMTQVNNRVAAQARKFVYAANDRQLRFVANRLGKMLPSTPLDTRPF